MKENRYIKLFLAFILLLPGFFLAGCEGPDGSNTQFDKKKHISKSGGYVYFTLADTDFKIPKKYFKGGARDTIRLTSAKLWALLPDFEGYDSDKNHYEFVDEIGWGRKIWISLRHRSEIQFVLKIIEGKEKTRGTLFNRVGRYDEMRYGLEYYKCPDSIICSEFYLNRPGGETRMYIRCPGKKRLPPSPSCEAIWDYSNGVSVEMVFGMHHLPQWRSILQKTQDLLRAGNQNLKSLPNPGKQNNSEAGDR